MRRGTRLFDQLLLLGFVGGGQLLQARSGALHVPAQELGSVLARLQRLVLHALQRHATVWDRLTHMAHSHTNTESKVREQSRPGCKHVRINAYFKQPREFLPYTVQIGSSIYPRQWSTDVKTRLSVAPHPELLPDGLLLLAGDAQAPQARVGGLVPFQLDGLAQLQPEVTCKPAFGAKLMITQDFPCPSTPVQGKSLPLAAGRMSMLDFRTEKLASLNA